MKSYIIPTQKLERNGLIMRLSRPRPAVILNQCLFWETVFIRDDFLCPGPTIKKRKNQKSYVRVYKFKVDKFLKLSVIVRWTNLKEWRGTWYRVQKFKDMHYKFKILTWVESVSDLGFKLSETIINKIKIK